MRESTFSFWQDPNFNALNDQPLLEINDAWHPEKAWDWWFFEGIFNDGYYAAISFFTADPLPGRSPGCPVLDIHVSTPQGNVQAVSEVCGEGELQASPERCDVLLARNLVRQEDGGWRVVVENGEAGADLTWRPILAGWKPGRGVIGYGDKGLSNLSWCVPMPRGEVAGHLVLQGRQVPVQGIGYHDHRDGNVALSDVAQQVHFGRLYGPHSTFLFAQWAGPYLYQWNKVPAVYLARDEQPLLSTGAAEVMAGNTEVERESGFPLARSCTVRASAGNLLEARLQAGPSLYRQSLDQEGRESRTWRRPLATARRAAGRLLLANGAQGEEAISGCWETILL